MTATNSMPVASVISSIPAKHAVSLDSQFSNSVELTQVIKAFRVGTTAGDVKVVTAAGDTVTIPNVQVGETIALFVKQIFVTGTGAVGLTGFYD